MGDALTRRSAALRAEPVALSQAKPAAAIAYYNEFDPKAAAWLRELIADGLIAPGIVDERDIRDVTPDELRSFRQVHLFAGIGGWSASLRKAGWADDRAVWTASCPCQPFSAAGARGGFADERHLWPAVYHLAGECRPDVLLGEQSSSKDGLTWFDLVSADMEAAGYSGGALDLCSAGFGAPNIRQRNYFVWMADAGCERSAGRREVRNLGGETASDESAGRQRQRLRDAAYDSRPIGGMADADGAGSQGRDRVPERADQRAAGTVGVACRLAYADGRDTGSEGLQRGWQYGLGTEDAGHSADVFSGAARGFWSGADWVLCRDEDGPTWRPVEPGSFPLASSLPGRVALLRGAGNAINVEVAAGFIESVIEVRANAERIAA